MLFDHDFHVHTIYSNDTSKKATVENYIPAAKAMGLKKVGIAEHFWDDRVPCDDPWYQVLTFQHVSQVREDMKPFADCGIQLYFGCEVEYDAKNRKPALTPEVAEQFDFVIVPNSHSHVTMPKEYYDVKEKHAAFILDAFRNIISCDVSRYVNAIAHPFSLVRCPYPCDDLIELVSDDEFKALFADTARAGIALEINMGSYLGGLGRLGLDITRADECQLMRMFRLAKAEGCRFFFGSDAHAPSHLENHEHTDVLADLLGLTEDDIMPIARK